MPLDHASGTISTRAEIISLAIRLAFAAGLSYITVRMLLKALNPEQPNKERTMKLAKEILQDLGVEADQITKLNEHEIQIATQLVPSMNPNAAWEDIGGNETLLKELQDRVILPISLKQHSALLSPPKGVLLYGPPGCGKTLMAKAIARAAHARFINLQVSTLTDKWYGESQKLAHAVFSLARKCQPTIIFIDEIDSFLRLRDLHDHEATAMMKAQFMSEWDGFASDPNCSVVIMGASNRPEDIDKAILRRMPARFHIKIPDSLQRSDILSVILKNEKLDAEVDLDAVAREAQGFSGSDLTEVCRMAALFKAKDLIGQGVELGCIEARARGLSQAELIKAVRKYKESKNLDAVDLIHQAALQLD